MCLRSDEEVEGADNLDQPFWGPHSWIFLFAERASWKKSTPLLWPFESGEIRVSLIGCAHVFQGQIVGSAFQWAVGQTALVIKPTEGTQKTWRIRHRGFHHVRQNQVRATDRWCEHSAKEALETPKTNARILWWGWKEKKSWRYCEHPTLHCAKNGGTQGKGKGKGKDVWLVFYMHGWAWIPVYCRGH